MKKIIFSFLTILHYLVWAFVLCAFVNIKSANINLFILIPFIYIAHCFPFHFIVTAKEKVIPDKIEREQELDYYDQLFIIPYYFIKLQKKLDKCCLFSPLTPQGMLIFGVLSSAFVLLRNKK